MSSTDNIPPRPNTPLVAIIGAGIAGLCTAIAFAKFGAKVVIFEKADELGEVGASLQLSPNATHILTDLGLLPALQKHWIEPQSICMTDGVSLKPIKTLPIARLSRDEWHAPYALMRRTDLQRELLNAVRDMPNCELRLSSELNFANIESLQTDIEQRLEQKPDLVIGADGVWSDTRSILPNGAGVDYTGYVAWRFMTDTKARAHMPANINNSSNIMLMMNGDGHIALYPSDQYEQSNIVFVTEHLGDPHVTPDFDAMLLSMSLNPATVRMLKSSDHLGCWTINHVAEGAWTNGANIALIGDAAHAMSPFMAQGAAMAIEDAYVLANLICNSGQAVSQGLQQYEKRRKARVDKVRTRAMTNRIAYHAKGPIRAARNLVLTLKSPESLCRDLNWLYGWRAERE
jgi:salicylate hydroxylase